MAAVTVAVLVALAPVLRPAPAHGGAGVVTSNYRVELQGTQPSTPGLHVEMVDVSGTLRLTWTGSGTVVVEGYDGEPYLRLDPDGVERNVHSPATYLNQNRYARVEIPPTADSGAPPEWQRISTDHSVAWHDHRTHWMDVNPPPVVQADPSAVHVIIDRWQVPLIVDGSAATIDGRLLWVPAPDATPWWALAAGTFAVLLGLLVTRWWRPVAVAAAAFATVVFTVDGFGFLARNHRGVLPWVWAFAWPLVAAAATVVLARQLRARRERMPMTMAVAGVVIAVVGGIDRLDGITHSQVFTALPDWAAPSGGRRLAGHRRRPRGPLPARRRPRRPHRPPGAVRSRFARRPRAGGARPMSCARWQEAISAAADGEDPGVDERMLAAHLARCAECRAFADFAGADRSRWRVRPAEPMPDLAPRVTKWAAVVDRASRWSIVRALLAVVAVEIIAFSLPALVLGDEQQTSAHAARHLGAFTVAYGVGLLLVVARPARARTMLPVAAVLAGALVITAIIDLVNGEVPLLGETGHLPEVLSVVLVWLLAVPTRRRRSRRTAVSGPPSLRLLADERDRDTG